VLHGAWIIKQLYDWILPLKGRERREFFNAMSGSIVFGCAVAGAMFGFS